MKDELRLAMTVATHSWTGTSMVDGALAFLQGVYAPHAFVGTDKECSRCGKLKSKH